MPITFGQRISTIVLDMAVRSTVSVSILLKLCRELPEESSMRTIRSIKDDRQYGKCLTAIYITSTLYPKLVIKFYHFNIYSFRIRELV